jgi:hypothetical protein
MDSYLGPADAVMVSPLPGVYSISLYAVSIYLDTLYLQNTSVYSFHHQQFTSINLYSNHL